MNFDLFEEMRHAKDKGMCFHMNVTNGVIFELRKHTHAHTPLERISIESYNVFEQFSFVNILKLFKVITKHKMYEE